MKTSARRLHRVTTHFKSICRTTAPMPMNPDALLLDLALGKEADARRLRGRVQDYLAACAIALPALYTAAAAGNVTCREAAAQISRLLGPVQTPAPTPSHPAPTAPPPADANPPAAETNQTPSA